MIVSRAFEKTSAAWSLTGCWAVLALSDGDVRLFTNFQCSNLIVHSPCFEPRQRGGFEHFFCWDKIVLLPSRFDKGRQISLFFEQIADVVARATESLPRPTAIPTQKLLRKGA